MPRPIARAYIDGFNLYYGALRDHNDRKWLNLEAWAKRMLGEWDIDRIVYCTARVDDSLARGARGRQGKYLQALQSTPVVEVLEGKFKLRTTLMMRSPHATCRRCGTPTGACGCGDTRILVQKPEEKGSDVNLAIQLTKDAVEGHMNVALIVSGDSDLQPAVDIATHHGVKTLIADPRNPQRSSLQGSERRQVRPKALKESQFPHEVKLPSGVSVMRPKVWKN